MNTFTVTCTGCEFFIRWKAATRMRHQTWVPLSTWQELSLSCPRELEASIRRLCLLNDEADTEGSGAGGSHYKLPVPSERTLYPGRGEHTNLKSREGNYLSNRRPRSQRNITGLILDGDSLPEGTRIHTSPLPLGTTRRKGGACHPGTWECLFPSPITCHSTPPLVHKHLTYPGLCKSL